MSSFDNAPETQPRGTRLDRWLAPPWRGLLTWVVLAGVTGAVDTLIGVQKVMPAIEWSSDLLDRHLPIPMGSGVTEVVFIVNTVLLFTWFEPLILRLKLRRGLVWLGLRAGLLLASKFLEGVHGAAMDAAIYLAWGVATVPVLRGWRSRPWMSVPGAVLAYVVLEAIRMLPETLPSWCGIAVVALPYAATMLYGTRRLRPDLNGDEPRASISIPTGDAASPP